MPPTLTKENEQRLVTMMKDVCGPLLAEMIEQQMAPFREAASQRGVQLLDAARGHGTDGVTVQPTEQAAVDVPKGERFGRIVRALAAGKGDIERSSRWYATQYGTKDSVYGMLTKALSSTDATAGGFLVPDEMAAEVIEFLRPMSRFRALNPEVLTMNAGTMRIPRQTGGATGTYIAENANITASEQTFGQVVANAKKLAVLTPISNDLLRRSAGANTIVRNDLVASLAQTSDLKFIRGDGTIGEPKGLRYWAPAANRLTVNATINTENVLADLGNLIVTVMNGNSRMLRPGWLMAPRTWNALMTMTTSTGNTVLREEMIAGRLMGFPFQITTQIPINLAVTGTNESELYFADFADAVIVEQESLILDASDTAAYHDGSAVVASFSQDQTVVRAIAEHDMVVRHGESVAVYTDVDWVAGITT